MMRLDKYLSNMGVGTRSEVKKAIGYGKVSVNDQVVKGLNLKIDETKDKITAYGQVIGYEEHVYIMLNKPAGVISATEAGKNKTAIDLISHPRKKQLSLVGRLDKDTEGLLLLTDDGQLAHRLLSPKKHVKKIYYAKIDGIVTVDHVKQFKAGLELEDFTTLPAELKILATGAKSEIEVTLMEGKFHQVKRMFEAVGSQVTYLKRIQMGGLALDETLSLGKYRELTKEELLLLETKQG